MIHKYIVAVLLSWLVPISTNLHAASAVQTNNTQPSITQKAWGTHDGKSVTLYTLTNRQGSHISITNYGAMLVSAYMPDKDGKLGDVVLGYDSLEPYFDQGYCFGATIGRFANRIKNSMFVLDGRTYHLTIGDKGNISHSNQDFNTAVWDVEVLKEKDRQGLRMRYLSPDGKDGFPGNVNSMVTYYLRDDNAIEIQFDATTDKATPISMTHHSYFNLSACERKVLDHYLWIDADNYLTIDDDVVPVGGLTPVKGTPEDLTTMTRIKDNIYKMDFGGYHYCYAFNKPVGKYAKVATLLDKESGRQMDVFTTQPGVQVYTSNALPEGIKGKHKRPYGVHEAICLETEGFPNAPNIPEFPSCIVRPGEKYHDVVVYQFSVKK